MKIINRYTGKIIYEAAVKTMKELVEMAVAEGVSLRYAYLYKVNLSETNLRTADLRQANLQYADLRECDLSFTNLRGTDLSRAYLFGANLTWALTESANFKDVEDRTITKLEDIEL